MHTIVQHSGFGYSGNPQFEKGLESRQVTKAEQRTVIAAGGILFPGYGSAEDYCETETDNGGLLPVAPGTFSDKEIDGLRIYIPKEAQQ